MDQKMLHSIEAHCTQEAPPACAAACPFQMDVRTFMTHIAAGKLPEARKLLERHLPLPTLLSRICDHPCESSCLRRDLGGSLSIHALEKLCLTAPPPRAPFLPRTRKTTRAGIFGCGLAGMVVAYELAQKAFPVTVYAHQPPEEFLCSIFPELDREHVIPEWQKLEKNGVTLVLQELSSETLALARQECDSLFIDAHAAPTFAPPTKADADSITLQVDEKTCCGGWLNTSPTGSCYASASQQAGDGRRAASTLQRFLTHVSITAARDDAQEGKQRLHVSLENILPSERILPHDGIHFTGEEAQKEAARCLQCQCLSCVKKCLLLEQHKGFPRTYARLIYNNASIVKGQHLANSLINGCTLCGQCTEICPERFSMAELCLMARQDMVTRQYMPPSAHAFAMEDMENALSDTCSLLFPSQKKLTHLFFPGCQLGAMRSEQVLAMYTWLQKHIDESQLGIWLSCCGIPAHWAGRETRFRDIIAQLDTAWKAAGEPLCLLACASCLKVFREFLPHIPVASLWETLDTMPDSIPAPSGKGQEYTLHDPCATRHDTAWQNAVRSLAQKCGYRLHEPEDTKECTTCCGYGGLVWNARPDLADAMIQQRADALPHPALASCIMCRERLATSGKESHHLFDILPQTAAYSPVQATEKEINLSARRARRASLKEALVQDTPFAPPQMTSIRFDTEVLETMERKHILYEDIEECILALEKSGKKFQETDSGHFAGSWHSHHVTFWVRYSKEKDTYLVHDAWSHRMLVPGTGNVNAEDVQQSCVGRNY